MHNLANLPRVQRPGSSARLRRAIAVATVCGAAAVQAAPVLVNGGFESGFAGWTRADQAGGEGTFFLQTGTMSPLNGDAVPAPPQGNTAAMTDGFGPGSHVLYQDFLAVVGPATVSFDLFIGNRADRFATPNSLRFDLTSPIGAETANQQARVDILSATADPFSVAAADVLLTLYATNLGDPLVSGYTTISTDITALLAARAGQTLRLRFAEVDNLGPQQMGVDNVGFATPTVALPEPGSLALVVAAAMAAGLGTVRRRAGPMLAAAGAAVLPLAAQADSIPAQMLDPTLQVEAFVNTGLSQPIGIAFLAANDFLVIEKGSGQVKRFINGVLQPQPVLDLAVNSNSERGLLNLALHPAFPAVPHVFISWTESSTGADSTAVADVALLGNRVDRFLWTGANLVLDANLLRYRARQTDNVPVPGHPGSNNNNENGNHNGGVMRFGPDGKLYVYIGDVGRRGWMQNLQNGPFTTAPFVDDTFGGPQPDNAHLAGVILRLNTDGSAPADNPFFGAGASIGGEVGVNLQKVFSYGHRNGFGMAFDPVSGSLWETENADDAYAELNRVVPGLNGGWIQFAGPVSRI
ncbi:MAG TPA: PQQ-dependent sugar dehydrogenase, partial [Rubrivivax sp.]|nr:PQQ-dependent sugar dehydrogenase [Rubrivivax sp.]